MGAVLACLLWDVWKFDRGASPAWQVGVHHLALALLFAMTFVFASRRPYAFSAGFRRFTLAAWVLAPVLVFCWGWLVNGPYEGMRDDRIFHWALASTSAFMLVWMAAIFPYTAFMLWKRREELLPVPGPADFPWLTSSERPDSPVQEDSAENPAQVDPTPAISRILAILQSSGGALPPCNKIQG